MIVGIVLMSLISVLGLILIMFIFDFNCSIDGVV